MSTPGPLLAVDASGCLSVARHRPPVRSSSWHREGSGGRFACGDNCVRLSPRRGDGGTCHESYARSACAHRRAQTLHTYFYKH